MSIKNDGERGGQGWRPASGFAPSPHCCRSGTACPFPPLLWFHPCCNPTLRHFRSNSAPIAAQGLALLPPSPCCSRSGPAPPLAPPLWV